MLRRRSRCEDEGMSHTEADTRSQVVLLATLDGLALVAFVLIGVRSHHAESTPIVFARNAVPLLVSWFGVGLVSHLYRDPSWRGLVRNWIFAVPIALLVRTWIVGSPSSVSRIALFVVVGMAFTLLFLLIGRAVAAGVGRRMIDGEGV
jgi:hypothetical protein